MKKINVISAFDGISCGRIALERAGYCSHVSPSQAYKQIGNGWTVDVIVQFVKNL